LGVVGGRVFETPDLMIKYFNFTSLHLNIMFACI